MNYFLISLIILQHTSINAKNKPDVTRIQNWILGIDGFHMENSKKVKIPRLKMLTNTIRELKSAKNKIISDKILKIPLIPIQSSDESSLARTESGHEEGINEFLYAIKLFNNDHDTLVLENYPDEITWSNCYRHIYKLLYQQSQFDKSQNFYDFKDIMYQHCCKILNKYEH